MKKHRSDAGEKGTIASICTISYMLLMKDHRMGNFIDLERLVFAKTKQKSVKRCLMSDINNDTGVTLRNAVRKLFEAPVNVLWYGPRLPEGLSIYQGAMVSGIPGSQLAS